MDYLVLADDLVVNGAAVQAFGHDEMAIQRDERPHGLAPLRLGLTPQPRRLAGFRLGWVAFSNASQKVGRPPSLPMTLGQFGPCLATRAALPFFPAAMRPGDAGIGLPSVELLARRLARVEKHESMGIKNEFERVSRLY